MPLLSNTICTATEDPYHGWRDSYGSWGGGGVGVGSYGR